MDNLLEQPIKKYMHLWIIFGIIRSFIAPDSSGSACEQALLDPAEKIYMSIKFFICSRKNLKVEDLEINKRYYIEYNGSFDKYNVYLSKFLEFHIHLKMVYL